MGAGPVAAAVALATRGRAATLVDPGRPAAPLQGPFDLRVYAISPGNVEFLRGLGVWDAIAPERLTPVHEMRVFGDDGASSVRFDAYRAGVPALAWMVEDAILASALREALARRDALAIVHSNLASITHEADAVRAGLVDGQSLAGRLLVGADGARSAVREQSGIGIRERDYRQIAVVATLECERPHRNTAFQWFDRGAVLALLPMPGRHVSMVWSLPEALGDAVQRLSPTELCGELARACGGLLGDMRLVSEASSYSLRRVQARRLIAPRTALVGDAAHVVHPLAGQGLNLGLQDVRALASALGERGADDPGAARVLRQYERSRAQPILEMDLAIDGLYSLFGTKARLPGALRNAGLNLVDRAPVLKNVLMRRAMS